MTDAAQHGRVMGRVREQIRYRPNSPEPRETAYSTTGMFPRAVNPRLPFDGQAGLIWWAWVGESPWRA